MKGTTIRNQVACPETKSIIVLSGRVTPTTQSPPTNPPHNPPRAWVATLAHRAAGQAGKIFSIVIFFTESGEPCGQKRREHVEAKLQLPTRNARNPSGSAQNRL